MSPINLAAVTLPAPDGTTVAFAEATGRTILLLANQKTGTAVRSVATSVQADPTLADVPIVQVAHLVGVPRLVRRLAERDVRQGLAGQRKQLQARLAAAGRPDDSATLLRLGLDWEGRVTTPLGFSAADEAPLLAVIDPDGTVEIAGHGSGALDRLRDLVTRPVELPR